MCQTEIKTLRAAMTIWNSVTRNKVEPSIICEESIGTGTPCRSSPIVPGLPGCFHMDHSLVLFYKEAGSEVSEPDSICTL